jgi:ABC-type phosphate transport system substrate-binding protein
VKVAIDALAVFVHKDNPIKGLTMQQVDSIFSSTFKAGGKDVTSWDQVGLAPGPARPSRSTAATAPPAPTASSRKSP